MLYVCTVHLLLLFTLIWHQYCEKCYVAAFTCLCFTVESLLNTDSFYSFSPRSLLMPSKLWLCFTKKCCLLSLFVLYLIINMNWTKECFRLFIFPSWIHKVDIVSLLGLHLTDWRVYLDRQFSTESYKFFKSYWL